MRILALTHRSPFPPDRGDRIRSFHLLNRLAEKHEIWLAAIDDSTGDAPVHEALDSFTVEHAVFVQSPMGRYKGALGSLLRGEPLTLGWFRHQGLREQLERWQRAHGFDVVFVYSSSMAPYWLELNERYGVPGVMDFIDVDSEKWGQYAEYARIPKRWIYAREQRMLAPFERRVAGLAHRSLLVSRAEVDTFERLSPGLRVEALLCGVDGEHFALPELSRRADPPRLVFVGQMSYHANADGVVWFADEVLPLVHAERPDVVFDIVGAHPTLDVQALAKRPGIRVTGWVEDVRPYIWEATLAVVPLRIAQGTQTKVLEAMAASVPVVATPQASRGIERPTGDHIAVHEDAEGFARAVLHLLAHPEVARAQARAGLRMVHELHSWDASAQRLEEILTAACQGSTS